MHHSFLLIKLEEQNKPEQNKPERHQNIQNKPEQNNYYFQKNIQINNIFKIYSNLIIFQIKNSFTRGCTTSCGANNNGACM